MKLRVTTDGCPFDVEIERMTHLFFEDCQLEVVAAPAATELASSIDIDIHLHMSEPKNGTLAAEGTLTVCGLARTHGDAAPSHDNPRDHTHTQHAAPSPGTPPDHPSHRQTQPHPIQASHTKIVPQGADAVTIRKRGKQAVLHVLHQLLEQYTGEHQPWGILTGIRPLKLVHTMYERGADKEAVRQQLLDEYLISPEKTELLLEIGDVQHEVVPDLYALDKEVSLYIGIPFCPTHCAYCTFPAYSMTEKATYVDAFLEAMDLEFAHLGRLLREYNIPVTSVYVGGGTPTSLRAHEMERMMESIFREIPRPESWREFTVEAGRPDTITPDRVAVMRRYGVNRISVNPQTFKASTLKEIGRGHTPDIVDHRFHYVRDAGFENINMDMILGLPGETLEDVRYTMERIERLNPESVTVHTMSFKRTAVVNQERDKFKIPHSQLVRQMMAEASAWSRGLGYHPYYVYRQKDILGNMENTGFAKAGKDSIYNICIMEERQTIVGIGGGAVTKLIGAGGKHMGRFANPREPKAYIDTIHEVLEKKDAHLRKVFESIQSSLQFADQH